MSAVDYNALDLERKNEVRANFENIFRRKETGNPNSLRGTVLHHVLESNYEVAIKELEAYAEEKRDFPTFKVKAHRYINHCRDLILAIQGKREFQGLTSLPVPKQKDMFEKIMDHYDELKNHLRQIEAVGHETFLDDVRSTVIVLKAATYSIFSILFVALMMDLYKDIFGTYSNVAFDVSGDVTSWIFEFIGL